MSCPENQKKGFFKRLVGEKGADGPGRANNGELKNAYALNDNKKKTVAVPVKVSHLDSFFNFHYVP